MHLNYFCAQFAVVLQAFADFDIGQDMATYVRDLRQDAISLRQRLQHTEAVKEQLHDELVTSLSQGSALRKAHGRLSGILQTGNGWQDDSCQTLESLVLDQSMEIQSLNRRLLESEARLGYPEAPDTQHTPDLRKSSQMQGSSLARYLSPQHLATNNSVAGNTRAEPSQKCTTNSTMPWQTTGNAEVESSEYKKNEAQRRQLVGAASTITKNRYNKSISGSPARLTASSLASLSGLQEGKPSGSPPFRRWNEVEGALAKARMAADTMMDEAITACDEEAQRLQRLLHLQGDKAQWAAMVQQQVLNLSQHDPRPNARLSSLLNI